MNALPLVAIAIAFSTAAHCQEGQGVIARCGASKGYSFYFKDDLFMPGGSKWADDAISNGKIILVRLGDEWDIQWDDSVLTSGYRQQGFKVVPLMNKPGMVAVGAFSETGSDIYVFDLANKTVGWTTNVIGPLAPKIGAFSAECE